MQNLMTKSTLVISERRLEDKKSPGLTASAIKRLELPGQGETQRVEWDADCLGLGLRLNHKGRIWIVQARGPGGGTVRRTIGRADGSEALTPSDARKQARQIRAQIEAGNAPQPLRKRAEATERPSAALTFAEVRNAFLADFERKKRSGASYRGLLNRVELAAWTDRPLAEITRGDVRRVFEAVTQTIQANGAARRAKRKKEERPVLPGELRLGAGVSANRMLSALSSLFKWAGEQRADVDPRLDGYNPARGWKSLRASEMKRERPIEPAEIPAIWRAADAAGEHWARIYRLLILLGCRRAEIQGLRWDEIRELEGNDPRLNLGFRSKAGEKLLREIPLPPAAVAILKATPRRGPFVFGLDRALFDDSAADARVRQAAALDFHWTPHAFRHAFGTWARKIAELPADTARTVLGHITGGYHSGALGAYSGGGVSPRLHRDALERWQAYLEGAGCVMPALPVASEDVTARTSSPLK